MRRGHWLLLAALVFLAWQAWQRHATAPTTGAEVAGSAGYPHDRAPETFPVAPPPALSLPNAAPGQFPPEVSRTLALIRSGGPFPYDRDGVVFGNFEGHLPRQARGYYHEYTVPTPGAHNRGARRIIVGGRPPSEYWYTGDHYDSFTRIDPGAMQ